MVWALSLSTMKLIPHRLTPWLHVVGIRSLTGDGIPRRTLSPISALPPTLTTRGSPYSNFGENQLSPSLIGLSPLSTSPPLSFQPEWVRSFTSCYGRCNLLMDSSLGFGSTARYWTPCSDSLSLRLPLHVLTWQHTVTRRLIMQEARHRPTKGGL